MDLIDLFIGSEGTLGIVTAATLRVLPARPATCLALVFFSERRRAIEFVRRLREAAEASWKSRDARGVDVSAIEHLDARSLTLIREDGMDHANGVRIPTEASVGLIITLELSAKTSSRDAFEQLGHANDADAPNAPLVRFARLLTEAGALDHVEIAVPGDKRRSAQLLAVREAVPAAVNARVGRAQAIDARITKTAADTIVPFDKLEEYLAFHDAQFERRGLDAAVWGHISDGNLHPNVIPRSRDDVESGKLAILELGREALRLGGAPLAEHGVGRNPIKQQLLQMMYGEKGIDAMRRVKRAIDPEWKLSPGVVFPRV
jgi:D-lactate dehydrogenase (cytochrome)